MRPWPHSPRRPALPPVSTQTSAKPWRAACVRALGLACQAARARRAGAPSRSNALALWRGKSGSHARSIAALRARSTRPSRPAPAPAVPVRGSRRGPAGCRSAASQERHAAGKPCPWRKNEPTFRRWSPATPATAMDQIVGAMLPPTCGKIGRPMHDGQGLPPHPLHYFHFASPDLLVCSDAEPPVTCVCCADPLRTRRGPVVQGVARTGCRV